MARAPAANSVVTLTEITRSSIGSVLALDVVPEQRRLLATNAESIAEAHFEKGAWFRAIEADGAPVGFVMLFDPSRPGATIEADDRPDELMLWRFMIDHRYQRRGYGRAALDLIVAHARTRPGIARIVSSYVPGEGGPRDFYLGYGFVETGEIDPDDDEVVIAYAL